MTDQHVRVWAKLIRQYPEAGWAGAIGALIASLGINFGWWLIALPRLINAHSDSLLYAAFFGSFAMVLLDVVFVVRAGRWANQIFAAIKDDGDTP